MMQVTIPRKSKWLILCGLAVSSSIVFMDSTILPVALPTIQKAFALSSVGLQWAVNSYLLVMASFVLIGGRLADLFGHRKMFCVGMSVFGAFSILGGSASSQVVLIIGRAFQGLGGALMIPASMAILADTFPEKERGRAIGILVSIGSIFLSLGPVVGGIFAEYLSWRWVFWVNVPMVLVGIYIILLSLPRSEKMKEKFDLPGCFAFIAMLTSLILALMQAREWGWSSVWVLLLFGLSAGFTVVLIYLLRRAQHPFMQYQLFKNSVFMGCNLLVACAQFLLMISVYWVLYFQTALHYTPAQAGALLLISTLPVMCGAPLSGYLADHFGPRVPVTVGFGLTLFALVLLLVLGPYPITPLIVALFLFGFGISLVMTPVGTTVVGSVPPHRKGAGMGIYNTIRHTAAPFAVAVLGSLMNNISFFSFMKHGAEERTLSGLPLGQYAELLAESKSLTPHIHGINMEQITLMRKLFAEASGRALFYTNLTCACVALLGLVLSVFYLWNPKKQTS